MAGLRTALAAFCAASPALAEVALEPRATPYHGLCQMTGVCTGAGQCALMPALGDTALHIDGHGTSMGRDWSALSRVDRFVTLDAALPLPEISEPRRSFLVDLPPDGTARRFALHVQTADPETGAPRLRSQSFVLSCAEVSR
jgi:hypothetical protein